MCLRHVEPDGGMQERMMLTLKDCPRCRGDMHSNRDLYGPYVECLQCGHVNYNVPEKAAGSRLRRGSKKPAAA